MFSFSIAGPPELSGRNTNGSQLTYTVYGVPEPKVTWGFSEDSITNAINSTERNDVYYAHDYSLSIMPNMCGKTLHFEAVGYRGKIITWSGNIEKYCKSQFYSPFCGKNYLVPVFLICFCKVAWVCFMKFTTLKRSAISILLLLMDFPHPFVVATLEGGSTIVMFGRVGILKTNFPREM